MSKRVADLVIETLQAAGVRSCYGIVGDTLNRIAHAIDRSEIDWVQMRHEEAGAFAAGAEALLTGRLTACAGSCGPGSLHFINGLYEANRNHAPVILIATQIVRQDLGFESIQEIDYEDVFKGCSVYCEMIVTPEQARRKTVAACQAALTKRGVAVLVVPADVANAAAHEEPPYAVHARRPLVRPSDEDLDAIAAILNKSEAITIYAGAGSRLCETMLPPSPDQPPMPVVTAGDWVCGENSTHPQETRRAVGRDRACRPGGDPLLVDTNGTTNAG
jgi:pyruvate dehydrogenase (quinone)